MNVYLIAKKNIEDVETIVFDIEGADAVFLFTEESDGQQYLRDAGLEKEYTLAEIADSDFAEWMVKCKQNGVKNLGINPTFQQVHTDKSVEVMNIDEHLTHFAQHFLEVSDPAF